MFCTECGTKLEDGAVFCTNCGHKLETEQTAAAEGVAAAAAVATPVAEAVSTPVAEPVQETAQNTYSQPASQSMYTEGSSQSMYSQPASQSMYSEGSSQSMYSQPTGQSAYSQPAGAAGGMAYGASQGGNYAGGQNTYSQPADASYAYNSMQQPPKKKKGKGCLIAIIIAAVLLILGIIGIIIVFIIGAAVVDSGNDYSYEYSYDYSYEYSYDDDDESDVPNSLDDMMDSADDYEYSESTSSYSVDDIYGYWEGTSTLVSVSGAAEMQEYLEELIGRPLTDEEIAGLKGETAGEDYFWFDIFEYEGWDGFWELELDMGDYFDYEILDTYDAVTYEDFADGYYYDACIELDENNCFEIEVMERDPYGEYGSQFFDSYDYDVQDEDCAEDGAYGFLINGQVVEGSNGTEIHGEIVIMFQYGDMSEPYGMAYDFVLNEQYIY